MDNNSTAATHDQQGGRTRPVLYQSTPTPSNAVPIRQQELATDTTPGSSSNDSSSLKAPTPTRKPHSLPNIDTRVSHIVIKDDPSADPLAEVQASPSVVLAQSPLSTENTTSTHSGERKHFKKHTRFTKGLRISRTVSKKQHNHDSISPSRSISRPTYISDSSPNSTRSVTSFIRRSQSKSPAPNAQAISLAYDFREGNSIPRG